MKNKNCPQKRNCIDYGNCNKCAIGEAIEKLHKKIERLTERERWISPQERLPKETLSTRFYPDTHYFSDKVIAICEDRTTGTIFPTVTFTVDGEWWEEKHEKCKVLYWKPFQCLPNDIRERWPKNE